MAKRKIIWSRTAYLQRKNILLYWNERNGSNLFSIKLLNESKKTTIQISKQPTIGKVTDIENVYCLPMNNYNIYYQFNENEIHIICFWDNRQNPEVLKSLLSLFT